METLKEMKYERIDFAEAKKKLEELTNHLKNASDAEEAFAIHQKYYQLSDHIQTMAALAMFRHSINTADPYYDQENAYYDKELPAFTNADILYQTTLYESAFRKKLEERIGKVAFKNIELQRKSNDPKIVSLQQEENTLVTEYEKLLSSAVFDWEGQNISMSEMGKYQTSPDRNVRKKAWDMVGAFMQEHSEEWDSLYDKLVHNRDRQAKKLGYQDYRTLGYYRMQRNCYGMEEVEAFRDQVKKYLVPFVCRLQEKRAKRLFVDTLKIYDNGVYFANGNPVPQGSPEEILRAGLSMYRELSEETADFMEKMMKGDMFDVLGRKNKRQGGYMELLAETRMPLIFANFNGTSGDVDVITHECGHAFQFYLAAQDDIREHWDITMETAETHSMSMEFFTNPWMEKFFDERAQDFCDMQLEDAICFIPYGCMVDEFQHIIFENPDMTPKERHQVWLSLEKQYRPYLCLEDVAFFAKGAWWQKQHHIYSMPFYYIDYCIAQVCALQYKIWMQKDYKEAWQSYLKLCKLSAGDFFVAMIRQVGLKNPFEDGFMKDLVEKLEKICFNKKEEQ